MNRYNSNTPNFKGTAIRSVNSLAKALFIDEEKLKRISHHSNNLYRIAQKIEKQDGTVRITYDAFPALKNVHRRIKSEILDSVIFPRYIIGCIKGKDYKANAEIHEGAAIVIAEDIGNFFPSTTSEKIYDIWKYFFCFSSDVAQHLTNLTVLNGGLPQGSITSPQLANLVFWRDEPKLYERFQANGIEYSRFVDDIVVSSKTPIEAHKKTEIVASIYSLINRNGYAAKRRKHEIKTRRERMTVTKLTVNKKAGLPKEEQSKIRAAVNRLEKMAIDEPSMATLEHEYQVVRGKVNHFARFHPGKAQELRIRLDQIRRKTPKISI